MNRIPKLGLLAAFAGLPVVLQAAVPAITDQEEHVLRGFFDRQSNAIALDKLALEKGSKDSVKKFAQGELDMYQKLAEAVSKVDDEFKLISQPISNGNMSPKLGQGVTRGVTELPAGASWVAPGVLKLLNGGGGPPGMAPGAGGAGGPPGGAGPGPGAAPGAGPGAGGAPGGAPPGGGAQGGPPGGGGGGRGGPMARYDYDLADMRKLSGEEFDKQYALRVAIAHNAMLGHINTELSEPGANPDLVAMAKSSFALIAAQNSNIERLLLGQDLGNGPPGARPAGGGAPVGGPAPQK